MRASLLTMLVVSAIPATALADARATAAALFEQGRKDMELGDYKKACSELKASNEAWADMGTKGALAGCLTHEGRLTSAWFLWKELADTERDADLKADAVAQAAALEPRLPHFVVTLAAPTPGLVVIADGNKIDLTLSVPLPVDPGTFSVSATAPGAVDWQHDFVAAEGRVTTVEVPALTVASAASPQSPPHQPPPVEASAAARRHSRHVVALTTVGAGVAALAVGGGFGLSANSKWSSANTDCGGNVDTCPSAASFAKAQGDISDARSAGLLSNVLVGVGAAAVVTGVVLWVTAPKVERPVVGWRMTPVVQPSAGSVTLGRSF